MSVIVVEPHTAQYAKIRRGGERFWVELISQGEDGFRARVASNTVDEDSPPFGAEIDLVAGEEVFDVMVDKPRLRRV